MTNNDELVKQLLRGLKSYERFKQAKGSAPFLRLATPDNIRALLDERANLITENANFRAALEYWQSAHKTGRYEPTVVAYESALNVLEDANEALSQSREAPREDK